VVVSSSGPRAEEVHGLEGDGDGNAAAGLELSAPEAAEGNGRGVRSSDTNEEDDIDEASCVEEEEDDSIDRDDADTGGDGVEGTDPFFAFGTPCRATAAA